MDEAGPRLVLDMETPSTDEARKGVFPGDLQPIPGGDCGPSGEVDFEKDGILET